MDSIAGEKDVCDQMVKKLGAGKKYLLTVRGHCRMDLGFQTDEFHQWMITSVRGVTFRNVLGESEAETAAIGAGHTGAIPSVVVQAWYSGVVVRTHYTVPCGLVVVLFESRAHVCMPLTGQIRATLARHSNWAVQTLNHQQSLSPQEDAICYVDCRNPQILKKWVQIGCRYVRPVPDSIFLSLSRLH